MKKFQIIDSQVLNEEKKSRSQCKRESTALQKLGEEYLALNEKAWRELELPEELILLLKEYKVTKTHEAKRRQLQRIGRFMRENLENTHS